MMTRIGKICLAAMLVVFVGCSGEPDANQVVVPSNGDGSGDGDVFDGGDVGLDADPDSDPNADADAGEEEDAGDGEENGGEDPSCGPIIDLGIIGDGFQETVTLDFEELENHLATRCDNAVDGNAAVFSFEILSYGVLNVESEVPLAIDIRQIRCDYLSGLSFCTEGELEADLLQETPYFLIVERLDGTAETTVDIDIRYESVPACDYEDEGKSQCLDDDVVEVCHFTRTSPDTPRLLAVECPDGCVNGRCRGDDCGDPIVVSDSFYWSGSNLMFFDNYNSVDQDSCSADGEGGLYLEGRELVFRIEGLSPGTQIDISVDHEYQNEPVILVKNTCSNQAACLAVLEGAGELSYTAQSAGTRFVFIESLWDIDGEFEISIDIQ